ncbi:hypothetical protein NGA_0186800 [Nannochloropsis gaditana CCMP526]|uniref:uncharacterized protein n=1 Tax=Nannochloropsis gaditana (strain CCMP526) TaxID=1093141 RepID=UPI00029F5D7D|nr:hypothetical protein NGA_0186800 [Nannochloropsis gaditana CCMP526]EKU22160.1 hypothetical protein NGA_0186800 [Nannochloropsis gaditana CCMP526]|eukprot:XP_005854196.1 hypothetical protein NGA_0186800 [Nannochloropsis gaditana CCMP526]
MQAVSLYSSTVLLVVLAVFMGCTVHAQEHDRSSRPFSRLQSTTGASSSSSSSVTSKQESSDKQTDDDFTKPSSRAGYLLNLTKNTFNPVQVFKDAMNTKGFKAILDNPDIQHRVLKDFPLLGALTGFSTIKDNRRLSAEEVRWQIRGKRRRKREGNLIYGRGNDETLNAQTKNSFSTGMNTLLNLADDAFFNKVNEPDKVSATLAKMAASSDPGIQNLFKRARAGEQGAVEELQDEFVNQHYSGMDGKAFREITKQHNGDKFKQMPEMMHFIQKDASLAKAFEDLSRMRDSDFPPTEKEMMATVEL